MLVLDFDDFLLLRFLLDLDDLALVRRLDNLAVQAEQDFAHVLVFFGDCVYAAKGYGS